MHNESDQSIQDFITKCELSYNNLVKQDAKVNITPLMLYHANLDSDTQKLCLAAMDLSHDSFLSQTKASLRKFAGSSLNNIKGSNSHTPVVVEQEVFEAAPLNEDVYYSERGSYPPPKFVNRRNAHAQSLHRQHGGHRNFNKIPVLCQSRGAG